MPRHPVLLFLALASPILLLVSAIDLPAGEVIFALVAVAFPIALIALGASHKDGLGPLRWPLVGLTIFFEICFVAMLLLRGQVLEAPWLGGLPLATAIQFYGVFLAPMLFVSWFYAATFEHYGLRSEDLDELRRRFRPAEDEREEA